MVEKRRVGGQITAVGEGGKVRVGEQIVERPETPAERQRFKKLVEEQRQKLRREKKRKALKEAAEKIDKELQNIDRFSSLKDFKEVFKNLPEKVKPFLETTPEKVKKKLQDRSEVISRKVQEFQKGIKKARQDIEEIKKEDVESSAERAENRADIQELRAEIETRKKALEQLQKAKSKLQEGVILDPREVIGAVEERRTAVEARKKEKAEQALEEFKKTQELKKKIEKIQKGRVTKVNREEGKVTVDGEVIDVPKEVAKNVRLSVVAEAQQEKREALQEFNKKIKQGKEITKSDVRALRRAGVDESRLRKIESQIQRREAVEAVNKKIEEGKNITKSDIQKLKEAGVSQSKIDKIKSARKAEAREELRKTIQEVGLRQDLPKPAKQLKLQKVSLQPQNLQKLQQQGTITQSARKAINELKKADFDLSIPQGTKRFVKGESLVQAPGIGTVVLTPEGRIRGLTKEETQELKQQDIEVNPAEFPVGIALEARDLAAAVAAPKQTIKEAVEVFTDPSKLRKSIVLTAKEAKQNPFRFAGRLAFEAALTKGAGLAGKFAGQKLKPVRDRLNKIKVFSEDKLKQIEQAKEELKKAGFGESSRAFQELRAQEKITKELSQLTTPTIEDISQLQKNLEELPKSKTQQQVTQNIKQIKETTENIQKRTKKFKDLVRGPNRIRSETAAEGLRKLFSDKFEPIPQTPKVKNLRQTPLQKIRQNADNIEKVTEVLQANVYDDNFGKLRQEAQKLTGKKIRVKENPNKKVFSLKNPDKTSNKKEVIVEDIVKKGQEKKQKKPENITKIDVRSKDEPLTKQQKRTIRQYEKEAEAQGEEVSDATRKFIAQNRDLFRNKRGAAQLQQPLRKAFRNTGQGVKKATQKVSQRNKQFSQKYGNVNKQTIPKKPGRTGQPWSPDEIRKFREAKRERITETKQQLEKSRRVVNDLAAIRSLLGVGVTESPTFQSATNTAVASVNELRKELKRIQEFPVPEPGQVPGQKVPAKPAKPEKIPAEAKKPEPKKPEPRKPEKKPEPKGKEPKKPRFPEPKKIPEPKQVRLPETRPTPQKGEKLSYVVRTQEGNRVVTRTAPLPLNRAKKELKELLERTRLTSAQLRIAGTTRQQDISSLSLKDFNIKRNTNLLREYVEPKDRRFNTAKERRARRKKR